jgi:hypothetical protein
VGPELEWNRDADQYVTRVAADGETRYIVGRVEQTTLGLEARLSYGFTPTLSLDVYAQPFLSSGSYSDFRVVADAGARDFDARIPLVSGLSYDPGAERYAGPDFGFENPDFNVREFRMNAVIRWEYRPGSTLFLVWTQAREEETLLGAFDVGPDLSRLFRAPATNVFMVKLNYWIGL